MGVIDESLAPAKIRVHVCKGDYNFTLGSEDGSYVYTDGVLDGRRVWIQRISVDLFFQERHQKQESSQHLFDGEVGRTSLAAEPLVAVGKQTCRTSKFNPLTFGFFGGAIPHSCGPTDVVMAMLTRS